MYLIAAEDQGGGGVLLDFIFQEQQLDCLWGCGLH